MSIYPVPYSTDFSKFSQRQLGFKWLNIYDPGNFKGLGLLCQGAMCAICSVREDEPGAKGVPAQVVPSPRSTWPWWVEKGANDKVPQQTQQGQKAGLGSVQEEQKTRTRYWVSSSITGAGTGGPSWAEMGPWDMGQVGEGPGDARQGQSSPKCLHSGY